MMNKRYSTISTVILLLSLISMSACRHQDLGTPDPGRGTHGTDPISELITLDQPVTLEVSVIAPNVVDPSQPSGTRAMTVGSLRAFGDLSGDYSRYSFDDRRKFTVNTKDPKDLWVIDEDKERLKKIVELSESALNGCDWITTLKILELPDDAYEVTGLVPRKPIDSSGRADIPGPVDDTKPWPDKVKVTLFKLPKSGILTFLANSQVYQSQYWSNPKNLGYLDLANPYYLGITPLFQLSDRLCDEWANNTYPDKAPTGVAYKRYQSDYLPMYGRIYNVSAYKDQLNNSQIKFSHSPGSPALKLNDSQNNVLLERAAAFVCIEWDHQCTQDPKQPDGYYYYSGEYLFDQVDLGLYCNLGSIIPGNWDGVLARAKSKMTMDRLPNGGFKFAFYSHSLYDGLISSGEEGYTPSVFSLLQRHGATKFYVSENYPTRPQDQNTIYVQLSKFKSTYNPTASTKRTYEFDGPRKSLKMDLPFGEKSATTGLYDIHRNTIYHVKLRLKQSSRGVIPYIVTDWSEVEIPAEL